MSSIRDSDPASAPRAIFPVALKIIILTVILSFTTLVITLIAAQRQASTQRAEMERRAEQAAQLVASLKVLEPLTGQSVPWEIYRQYVRVVASLDESIAFVALFDSGGSLIGLTSNGETLSALTKGRIDDASLARQLAAEKPLAGTGVLLVEGVITAGGGTRGRVLVGFSPKGMQREVLALRLRGLFLALVLLVIGLAGAFVVGRSITGPIAQLTAAMGRVKEGDFSAALAIRSRDEFSVMGATFNGMLSGLQERDWIKDTFSRMVSHQVAEKLLQEKGALVLGGEKREITVLFSDIRGFTSMSERMDPHDVVTLLNRYFDRMVEVIFSYGGTLDKFIGDAIMVIFGAPLAAEDDHLRAVACALDMQRNLDELNAALSSQGLTTLGVGFGLNTGLAVVGNIGSEKHFAYSAIGDTVNLASRLCGQAAAAQVIVSESTYEKVKALVIAAPLPTVKVKGKEKEVSIYLVKGLAAGVTVRKVEGKV